MSMVPRGMLNMPEKIGNYQVQSVIGEGTMGIVYKGWDSRFNRPVALKTIRKELLEGSDDRFLRRIRTEAQAAGGLNHECIVTIYDLAEHDGAPVIVMELAEGITLEEFLRQGKQYDLRDTIKIITQVLDALEHAHERGVVHRDIKPANIMIRDRAKIKLMDFGVAKIQDSNVTLYGEVFGTPNYMSPEQWHGERLDKRTDIFSSGVVFYQLLTRIKPFEGDNFSETRWNVLNANPEAPSKINPAIPDGFDAVVLKSLSRTVEGRFQSAAEFREAIFAAEQAMGLPPKDPTIPPSGRAKAEGTVPPTLSAAKRPAWQIPAAGALVAVLAVLSYMLWPTTKPAAPNIPPLAETPKPAAKPIVGRVNIISEPAGASIFLANGKQLGVTPSTISLEPGIYRLEIKKDGYAPWQESVDVVREKDTQVTATLIAKVKPPETIPSDAKESGTQANPTVAKPPDVKVEPPVIKPPVTGLPDTATATPGTAPQAPVAVPAPIAPTTTPADLQRTLRQALNEQGYRSVQVIVRKNNAVLVKGNLKTQEDKDAVVGLIHGNASVTEVLDNELRVLSGADTARFKLQQELRSKLRGLNVTAIVQPDLRVILRGKLASQEQIVQAVQIAQNTSQVRSVINKMTLKQGLSTLPIEAKSNRNEATPIERLVSSINSSLQQYKLQNTGEITNIRARSEGSAVIVLAGSAARADQQQSAVDAARRIVGDRAQVRNEITVMRR